MRRTMLRLVLIALGVGSANATFGQTGVGSVFNVADFHAANDGKTLCTAAIQAAVDRCAERGGGTVYLPPGVYLTGTIVLKSNVTLHLEAGATLLGSRDLKDYPPHVPELRSFTDSYTDKSLLYAEKAENIALVGRGAIDGQGKWFPGKHAYRSRPYLIRFIECRNVRVRDVTLQRSAMWTLHLLACEDVVVDGARINTLPAVNHTNDGIDVDSSRRVRIANCDISTEDDAIVLKSTTTRPCEHVAVTNCTLRSDRAGFKLGTESVGGFRDVTMSNCTIRDAKGTGIAILEVDGGTCERITINNVILHNVGLNALFIRLGNRARSHWVARPGDKPSDAPPAPGMGKMRNILISNVLATGVKATGILMSGLPDHPVENVTLSNVQIGTKGGGDQKTARRFDVPESEKDYPAPRFFGPIPAYGFYGRHVKNLRLHDVELSFGGDEARPPVVCQNVGDLDLFGLRAETGPIADCVIRLRDVDDAFIHGCRLRNPIDRVVDHATNCTRIKILGNAFDEPSK